MLTMRPSDVRALIGSYVFPNVPGRDDASTIRYKVVGLSSGNVRLVTEHGQRETVTIAQFGKWIDDGYLVIRE